MAVKTNWLVKSSAVDLRRALAGRKVRATELVEEARERAQAIDGKIRVFLSTSWEQALALAAEVDRKLQRGDKLGPLAGLPIAVKDNICTKDTATTCGSRFLENWKPPYAATVVERILAAGGIVVGKTNLDEFAMGSSTENSGFFPTRNPWDPERIPGGSSGGSAAAVAAGLASLALGSDTGGSIRQPASLCGVTGLKPTYGRVSRYGLVAFASSLDQIGPITRNVSDAALLLGVIAGHDPRDSTSAPVEVPDYFREMESGVRGMTLGIPREYLGPGCDRDVEARVREAIEVYRKLGARIVEVSLPHTDYGIAAYYVVAPCEASSNLARYDGVKYGLRAPGDLGMIEMYCRSKKAGYGAEVKRRIMLGTFALSSGYYDAYYLKALKVRRLIKEDFDRAFAQAEALLCPTSPIPAFRLGEKTEDPLQMYLSDVFTVCCNLAGICGISIPCGFSSGDLPVGLQILGKPFGEATILRVGRAFERETEVAHRLPPLVDQGG